MLKLNLGCGANWRAPGWVGIDYSPTAPIWDRTGEPGAFVNFDLRMGIPFETCSAGVVFSSHTLEHFTYHEGTYLLYEIYRVLAPGGALCLIVPDLDVYLERLRQRDREFFAVPEIVGGVPADNLTDGFLMNCYSDPRFNGTCHRYAYNEENLRSRLERVGFVDVERVAFHDFGLCPELREATMRSAIPHLERFSLSMQCRKAEHDPDYVEHRSYGDAVRYSVVGRPQAAVLQELATQRLVQADHAVEREHRERALAELRRALAETRDERDRLARRLENLAAAGSAPHVQRGASFDPGAPLLLIGAGRSGSTLLSSILDRHPDVSFGAENHFLVPRLWQDFFDKRREMISSPSPYTVFLDWLYGWENLWRDDADAPPADKEEFCAQEQRRICGLIAGWVFEAMKLDPGCARWGYKELWNGSPGFAPFDWEIYDAVFPRAIWIHIVRDPFTFVPSAVGLDSEPPTRELMLKKLRDWVGVNECSLERERTGRYLRIRYEDVVERREAALRPLLGRLGLEWSERCLGAFQHRYMKSRDNVDQEFRELLTAAPIAVPGLTRLVRAFGYGDAVSARGIRLADACRPSPEIGGMLASAVAIGERSD